MAERGSGLNLTRCVDAAKALHRTLVSRAPDAEFISGKAANRQTTEKSHLAVVPLPDVGHDYADGHLLGIALVLPRDTVLTDRRQPRELLARWELDVDAQSPIPLRVAILRGGIPRDAGWARTPDQPLVIASTVDQLGSRLLFRGYGVSWSMRPVHAGLIGNDTLILLDEVHLSRPFAQTLQAITTLRNHGHVAIGLHVVALSATPGATKEEPFRLPDVDRKEGAIAKRIRAKKPARLVECAGRDALVHSAAKEVASLLKKPVWFDRNSNRARLQVDELETEEAIVSLIIERYFSEERVKELALLGLADMPKAFKNDDAEGHILSVLQLADQAITEPNSTRWSFISGVLCDGLTKRSANDLAAETTLCAANGGSHKKMFQTVRDLRNVAINSDGMWERKPALVTPEHLKSAMTSLWRFADAVPLDLLGKVGGMGDRKPTMYWDEHAERLHALRLRDPTNKAETFTTQLGAQALAAQALSCFPCFPVRRGGLTTFTRRSRDAGESIFYWPLWDVPISLATFLASHASGEALRKSSDARLRGVYRLMSVRRMTQDQGKLTFQSPEAVW